MVNLIWTLTLFHSMMKLGLTFFSFPVRWNCVFFVLTCISWGARMSQWWEEKPPTSVTRVQIPASTQHVRVSMGLTVSRREGYFFYRQPSKMHSNINRHNVLRYCKSDYFSWSSRTFGSWRISSLEKPLAMLSKHSLWTLQDLTTLLCLKIFGYFKIIMWKAKATSSTQQLSNRS